MSSGQPQEQGSWLKARIANAVGTTQLTISGIHGQPNLSGSKRTRRSTVRNFHFHNQLDSLPTHSSNQPMPRNLAGMALTASRRAIIASDVTQTPSSSSPKKAGQLPFGFCTRRRKSWARRSASESSDPIASVARHVGSSDV